MPMYSSKFRPTLTRLEIIHLEVLLVMDIRYLTSLPNTADLIERQRATLAKLERSHANR